MKSHNLFSVIHSTQRFWGSDPNSSGSDRIPEKLFSFPQYLPLVAFITKYLKIQQCVYIEIESRATQEETLTNLILNLLKSVVAAIQWHFLVEDS